MDPSAARDYFESLLDYAFDLTYVRSLGENHVEFLYVQCARVVENYSSIKPKLLKDMEHSLVCQYAVENDAKKRPDGFIPAEFIWFLAHRTRWPEFEAMAGRISDLPEDVWRSNPLRRSSLTLREALSNDWEDSDFYSSFSGAQPWPN
jgi:hypothetical protein